MIALIQLGHIMDVILKKYFWVLNLLTIAFCATFAGRAVAGMLASAVLGNEGTAAPGREAPLAAGPGPGEPEHNKDVELILKRNVFCSACAPIKLTEDKQADGPVDDTPRPSTLQLQLLVTMVSDDLQWSMAVVRDLQDDKKRVGIYRRGDHLQQGGAVVAQVVPRRVYLVVGQRVEYIDQDGAPPPPASPAVAAVTPEPNPGDPSGLEKDIDKGVRCTGGNCEVDRSLVDKLLSNTTALATSARFVPSIKDGKPNGFKVYAIRPGSVFAKLGMQNADLVKAINGLDMSTPDKALEAYTKLKSASHLTMLLERRGETITLDYQIR